MADFMNSEGFGLKIYERFPPRYQEDDADNRFALRRYLDACGEGGFKYGIDEWNGILDFANPDQATPQALPLLYEQYGLPIFNGIPEAYLRYLLPRLGRAWQKKGGLDVIEFVASALAGVKTNTTVRYDQYQNVDIDLRLEMDYALGDYFPDTAQLYRLLERFLPFYLGMTIVYSYLFHDKFSVHGEDTPHFDTITNLFTERGKFYPTGYRLTPVTFPADCRGLNVDFILNRYELVAPDTDPFRDTIGIKYHEKGSLFHRFTQFNPYVPMLNTNKVLNDTFVLYGGKLYLPEGVHPVGTLNNPAFGLNDSLRTSPPLYIEVDSHFDKVITSPVNETTTLRAEEDNKVHVVMRPTFYHTLNMSHATLNGGFVTNQSNIEEGRVGTKDTEAFSVRNVIKERATLVFNPLVCLLTNTPGLVLNHSVLKVPDEIDVIRYRDGSCHSVFR